MRAFSLNKVSSLPFVDVKDYISRSIIFVGANIIFVCGWKCNRPLRVELKNRACSHLMSQLRIVVSKCRPIGKLIYLVLIIEFLVIPLFNEFPGAFIVEIDSVVEIAKP